MSDWADEQDRLDAEFAESDEDLADWLQLSGECYLTRHEVGDFQAGYRKVRVLHEPTGEVGVVCRTRQGGVDVPWAELRDIAYMCLAERLNDSGWEWGDD